MSRIIPFFLVLVVCITCLVSPVSAVTGSNFHDLLDYSSVNDSGDNYFSFTNSGTIYFDVPSKAVYRYVDMLVTFNGAIPTSVSVGPSASSTNFELTLQKVSGRLYRVYGDLDSKTYTQFYINFVTGSSSTTYCTIHSCKVSFVATDTVSSTARLWVYDSFGGSSYVTMSSPDEEPEIFLTYLEGSTVTAGDFTCEISLTEWIRFSSMDVLVFLDIEQINTIFVRQGDTLLDYDISYVTPHASGSIKDYFWVMVHVDLSKCSLESSEVPKLDITGTYYNQLDSCKIRLKSVTGYAELPEPNVLITFWYNLRDFFSSKFSTLFDKIDEAFGMNDHSASSAQQTQEEINVSVNNQLVGAVEDWNTHIEVVQTGYDSALTKATPALGWLASLADRIFSNMGWFGNIYFLIGLISVIMLVLSKSGLARSVSRFRRND